MKKKNPASPNRKAGFLFFVEAHAQCVEFTA
jgi:hypothetical protein